jgi:hypothetical protein
VVRERQKLFQATQFARTRPYTVIYSPCLLVCEEVKRYKGEVATAETYRRRMMGSRRRWSVCTIGDHRVGNPHLFVLLRGVCLVALGLGKRIAEYKMVCLDSHLSTKIPRTTGRSPVHLNSIGGILEFQVRMQNDLPRGAMSPSRRGHFASMSRPQLWVSVLVYGPF